jgi:hypothetical protein
MRQYTALPRRRGHPGPAAPSERHQWSKRGVCGVFGPRVRSVRRPPPDRAWAKRSMPGDKPSCDSCGDACGLRMSNWRECSKPHRGCQDEVFGTDGSQMFDRTFPLRAHGHEACGLQVNASGQGWSLKGCWPRRPTPPGRGEGPGTSWPLAGPSPGDARAYWHTQVWPKTPLFSRLFRDHQPLVRMGGGF